ncbi:hypothetical protein FIBSPDRAFT_936273 [Athelia psychrophila]|uniref:Uncharacterized protein n=1 Tax=Athelia psychrophila TaxID=1759441 RepID=A0A166CD45_9AGAM|nr:hypothetical protein FIBSPDRAFT_936273 [Fibularhizoctonia sp. CBS 109695]
MSTLISSAGSASHIKECDDLSSACSVDALQVDLSDGKMKQNTSGAAASMATVHPWTFQVVVLPVRIAVELASAGRLELASPTGAYCTFLGAQSPSKERLDWYNFCRQELRIRWRASDMSVAYFVYAIGTCDDLQSESVQNPVQPTDADHTESKRKCTSEPLSKGSDKEVLFVVFEGKHVAPLQSFIYELLYTKAPERSEEIAERRTTVVKVVQCYGVRLESLPIARVSILQNEIRNHGRALPNTGMQPRVRVGRSVLRRQGAAAAGSDLVRESMRPPPVTVEKNQAGNGNSNPCCRLDTATRPTEQDTKHKNPAQGRVGHRIRQIGKPCST